MDGWALEGRSEHLPEAETQAVFLGTDETGVKVNGQKGWTCPPAGRCGPAKMMILLFSLIPITGDLMEKNLEPRSTIYSEGY